MPKKEPSSLEADEIQNPSSPSIVKYVAFFKKTFCKYVCLYCSDWKNYNNAYLPIML